jgi:hypothetical protein
MRRPATLIAAMLLVVPVPSNAQEADSIPWASLPAAYPGVGASFEGGTGPEDVGLVGASLRVAVPVWQYLALTGEYTAWHLTTRVGCPVNPWEYRFPCEVRGNHTLKLVGVAAVLPMSEYGALMTGIAGGYWDAPATANARSVEAGARFRIFRGLHLRLGVRWLRVFDGPLEDRIGEALTYRTRMLGIECRLPFGDG